jgi:hypothetical protein
MGLNGGDHFTTSSSNSNILKFVKVLNEPRVACIVPNTSQTLTFQLIDCLTPNSNSFVLNNSNVLVLIILIVNTI